jgi:hypothetical protein
MVIHIIIQKKRYAQIFWIEFKLSKKDGGGGGVGSNFVVSMILLVVSQVTVEMSFL